MSLLTKPDTRRVAQRSSDLGAPRRFNASFRLRLQSLKEAVAGGTVPEGTIWLVRIIEAGTSLNGVTYTETALRASAPVFEGVAVRNYAWSKDPAAKDAGHLPDAIAALDSRGLVGNEIGSLEGVHYNEQAKALDGYLKVYDTSFRERMLTAYKLGDIGEGGKRDVFGFSIDAGGEQDEAGNVIRITTANELTAVSDPAAGGRVRRLVAAAENTDAAKVDAVDLEEEDKATTTSPGEIAEQVHEPERKTMADIFKKKLTENVATLAGQLKLFADQLSTASDDEAKAMLEQVQVEIKKVLDDVYGTDEPTEDEGAESQEASVKKDEQEGGANATQDDFARMSAGMGKVREALKTGDPIALREAAVEVLGEEPEMDEKDKAIATLTERLKGQAISQAMTKLTESMGLIDPATVLVLMDRSGLQFDADYSAEVGGLKEAIKAVIKDRPYLVSVKEAKADDAAPAAPAPGAPAAAANAPAAPAPEGDRKVEALSPQEAAAAVLAAATPAPAALGQDVVLRESAPAATREITPAVQRTFARLQKRMKAGDTKAMKKHRDLRAHYGI